MKTNLIIQGDCLEVLKTLELDRDKVIFVSDPPFNIGYHYKNYKDKMPEQEYFNFLKQVFGRNKQVIVHYPEQLYRHSQNIGLFPEKIVSWVYNSNTAKQHRDIAFYGIKPDFTKVGQPYKNPTDKRIQERMKQGKTARLYDWWEINQVKNVSKDKTNHPCQMPLEVMKRIIGLLPEGFIIVDPFAGSGTTGLACKELGREYILIEISPEYCKIANKRIDKLSSKQEVSNG
jgi:DNA modification methylase